MQIVPTDPEGRLLRDAGAIFARQKLKALKHDIEVITELTSDNNVAFLRPTQPIHDLGWTATFFQPAYMSGEASGNRSLLYLIYLTRAAAHLSAL